jgi:hypothetical protein
MIRTCELIFATENNELIPNVGQSTTQVEVLDTFDNSVGEVKIDSINKIINKHKYFTRGQFEYTYLTYEFNKGLQWQNSSLKLVYKKHKMPIPNYDGQANKLEELTTILVSHCNWIELESAGRLDGVISQAVRVADKIMRKSNADKRFIEGNTNTD